MGLTFHAKTKGPFLAGVTDKVTGYCEIIPCCQITEGLDKSE